MTSSRDSRNENSWWQLLRSFVLKIAESDNTLGWSWLFGSHVKDIFFYKRRSPKAARLRLWPYASLPCAARNDAMVLYGYISQMSYPILYRKARRDSARENEGRYCTNRALFNSQFNDMKESWFFSRIRLRSHTD